MKKLIFVIFLISLLAGCGPMKGIEASRNRNRLANLKVGITKAEVREIMGNPYKNEFYENAEIWFYITEWQRDGYTTSDEMTPLVFKDERLIVWGSSFIDENLKKYELRIR